MSMKYYACVPSTDPWKGFAEYTKKVFGERWVIAPKTKSNSIRYEGYTLITRKQYQKAYEDFLACQ